MRVKFPANCKHPPYSHPYREVATVISGRIGFAAGDTFDTSKGDIGGAGSLGVVPPIDRTLSGRRTRKRVADAADKLRRYRGRLSRSQAFVRY